ncbi:tRNA-dihydrouridine synthase [Salinispirillum marinum]|uniref:tRNA-dihydrouridine(16) synthase n=2 Tax=Saccharospirillaceae TaxID=255527 RepID=A0ABV8BL03_9GAMM
MTTKLSEATRGFDPKPGISHRPDRLYLAPMEGVMDATMRDIITRQGRFDLCVTEFLRVVDELLPAKVFYRLCPELHHGARTSNGTPVRVQLLGNNPEAMAANAARAVALGSPGVDVNFGCPAKTVNRSRGGAVLLTEPDTLYDIVKAIRTELPSTQPVTAKMRLGYTDSTLALENALALESAGAAEIVIHARTKTDGYTPPAYWELIAPIAARLHIPVVANGEVWNRHDYLRCQAQSGVAAVMVGRGALAVPNVAAVLRDGASPMPWHEVLDRVIALGEHDQAHGKARYMPSRIKQWLNYLKIGYAEAQALFDDVRRLRDADTMDAALRQAQKHHPSTNVRGSHGEAITEVSHRTAGGA